MHKPFIIKTNHQTLKYMLEQKECNPTLKKWLSKLLGLFCIKREVKTWWLMLYLEEMVLMIKFAISDVMTNWHDKIQLSVPVDGKLQALIDVLKDNPTMSNKYQFSSGVLTRIGKRLVGHDPILQRQLIQFFHTSDFGRHSGIHATTQRIDGLLYWKGMQSQVRSFVRECVICQRNKYDTAASPSLLQPLEIPNRFWHTISMEFIEGLPKSDGFTNILVVVDKLSKFGHFIPLKHPYSTVSKAFLDNITKLYGMPSKIIFDRDPIFLSSFCKDLFKSHHTFLSYSTAYHPQSDGQTEVLNRYLETYLRCYTIDKSTSWSAWLPLAQLWYNTSITQVC